LRASFCTTFSSAVIVGTRWNDSCGRAGLPLHGGVAGHLLRADNHGEGGTFALMALGLGSERAALEKLGRLIP
jgi:hypothetical protein